MAAVLGIDWSPQALRVVACDGRGPQPAFAGCLEIPAPFAPAQAEALGAQLKGLLKAGGLKAGSAVAVIGREQLLCRDIRCPNVPDEERPSLIQFQTLKEITLGPEEAVIDFLPLSQPWPTGEQRVLAMVLRRGHLAALQKLCQAAGLKLEGVVPSPLAHLANALPFLQQASPTTALLAPGELLVVHNKEVVFTRPLEPEEPLAQALRRGLAGYAALYPKQPIQELLAAAAAPSVELEAAVGSVRLPVRFYDPLGGARPTLNSAPETLAAPLGAAQATHLWRKLPIDFQAPKKNQPKPNKRRFYAITGGAAAAGLFVLVGAFYWLASAEVDDTLSRLQAAIADKKKAIGAFGNLEERYTAISNWAGSEVVMLDELYDLAARFPDASGIRIIRAEWSPAAAPAFGAAGRAAAPAKPSGTTPSAAPLAPPKKNTKPIGKLVLVVQADAPDKLDEFRRELDRGHWRVDQWEKDQNASNQILAVVKVFPQEAKEYIAKLEPGVHRTQPGVIQPEGTRPGRFGGTRAPTSGRGGRP